MFVEIGKKVANGEVPRIGMEMGPAIESVNLEAAGSADGVDLGVGPSKSEADALRGGRSSWVDTDSSVAEGRCSTLGVAAGSLSRRQVGPGGRSKGRAELRKDSKLGTSAEAGVVEVGTRFRARAGIGVRTRVGVRIVVEAGIGVEVRTEVGNRV